MAHNMKRKPSGNPLKPGNRPKFNIFWAYGILAAIIIGWGLMSDRSATQKVDWTTFRDLIVKGEVEKVEVLNKSVAEIHLNPNAVKKYRDQEKYRNIPDDGVQFTYNIPSVEIFHPRFEEAVQEYGKDVLLEYETRRNVWVDMLSYILPFAIIIGIWILFMRGMARNTGGGGGAGGGIFNVGKAKAQMFDGDNRVKTSFKDVAGLHEAKVEIMEIVDFLKKPQKYKELGGKIPKGALLVGPPGTGKTLLAKAVAGEANVPFFSISGSDFVEMFVGVGASRVRDLFRQAKEKAPCIVFIDEIDAIGRARGRNVGYSSNDERENTLNQLLTEMDGFGTNSGVIILAATNRADILDKALMRAGRFDRQIEVGLPELSDRREIFDVHLRGIKLIDDFDREFLAQQTPGFSGADIANVCNEAALIAARKNKSFVDRDDFLDAIDRIVGGMERKSLVISPREKKQTAYHEAGHAAVSWLLEHAHPLIKVTIIPRGQSLGAAWYLPDERKLTTREQFMHELASTMGGRAAELIHFGVLSTGAISDLEKATKLAHAMVVYYGMSDTVGNVSYYDSTGQSDMSFAKPFSEKTAQEIDREVRRITDEAMATAIDVLKKNEEKYIELAELLLEREVIFTEDVEKVFGKRKADIVAEREAKEQKAEKSSEEDKKIDSGKESEDSQKTENTISEEAEQTTEKKSDTTKDEES